MHRFAPFDFISENPPRGDLNGLHSAQKRNQFFDIYIVIGKSSGGYWSGGVGWGGVVE